MSREEITDIPQERTGQHFGGEPVSRVMKEIVEVMLLFPSGGHHSTAEEIVIPQERFSERIAEQIGDFFVPQFVEEIVNMVHTFRQERCHHCTVE